MDRRVIFDPRARAELIWWKSEDLKTAKRILGLIKDIQERPFKGMGKPEPLKHDLQGYWSRRINKVDRLVYKVTGDALIIFSCRHHYTKYDK